MTCAASHGGAALRFLFDLPRYSEDLDFALEQPDAYDFEGWLRNCSRDLRAEGYAVGIKMSVDRTMNSAFVRFPGLPFELDLSPHPAQVMAIQIEVDTNPPAGAKLATTVVRRHVLLNLHHHDRGSLFAGKLHAVLQRPYVKGRDLYDLVWYLADPRWPEPNLEFLSNALAQSGWPGPQPTAENWRDLVAARVQAIEWEAAVSDVRPFLEDPAEVELLAPQHVLSLLERR